jgi:hypothetical protein
LRPRVTRTADGGNRPKVVKPNQSFEKGHTTANTSKKQTSTKFYQQHGFSSNISSDIPNNMIESGGFQSVKVDTQYRMPHLNTHNWNVNSNQDLDQHIDEPDGQTLVEQNKVYVSSLT